MPYGKILYGTQKILVECPKKHKTNVTQLLENVSKGIKGYKPYGCWHCPIACGGKMVQKSGKFALDLNDGVGHKPEYETLAMFGSNLLNKDRYFFLKQWSALLLAEHIMERLSLG
jgi:aldehyde:ferredoxin oxidoreductase